MGREFLTVYWREMIRFVRFRGLLFASLIQPALWLLLFGVAMVSNFDNSAIPMPDFPGVVSIDYLTGSRSRVPGAFGVRPARCPGSESTARITENRAPANRAPATEHLELIRAV